MHKHNVLFTDLFFGLTVEIQEIHCMYPLLVYMYIFWLTHTNVKLHEWTNGICARIGPILAENRQKWIVAKCCVTCEKYFFKTKRNMSFKIKFLTWSVCSNFRLLTWWQQCIAYLFSGLVILYWLAWQQFATWKLIPKVFCHHLFKCVKEDVSATNLKLVWIIITSNELF